LFYDQSKDNNKNLIKKINKKIYKYFYDNSTNENEDNYM